MAFTRREIKQRYLAKPEKQELTKNYMREYGKRRVRTRTNRRAETLRRRYGLTVGQVIEIAEAQANTCPLCSRQFPSENILSRRGNELVVDHDHETGKVRGLLCRACNVLLGRFGDSAERIEEFLSRVRSYLGKV